MLPPPILNTFFLCSFFGTTFSRDLKESQPDDPPGARGPARAITPAVVPIALGGQKFAD
jgi:hypothetical protein